MRSIKIFVIIALTTFCFSCKKEGFGPLTDPKAEIPVNVSNATEYRPGPTVVVSRANPTINIVLEIPTTSGRTIKEITRVAATSGTSAPLFGTTGLYNSAPIPGNGTKATFTTTLSEYTSKTGQNVPANNPPVNGVELTRQFYFLITLDDGQQLVSQQVRVLVTP